MNTWLNQQRLPKLLILSLVIILISVISYFAVVILSVSSVPKPASATITSGVNALDEIGQYDSDQTGQLINLFTKVGPNTFEGNAASRAAFNNPAGLALDTLHHRLFLADSDNNRVLVYALNSNNTLPDRVPEFVLGQSSFNDATASVAATRLSAPIGLAYDAGTDRLFVADSVNNRVLIFDVSTIINGEAAINVLGQTNFTDSSSAFSATGLNTPQGLAFDSLSSRLFVADSANNRVIIYDVAAVTAGESAVSVLGQSDFTSHAAATTQVGLSSPSGVLYDSAHTRLYVTDKANNRLTVYGVASITNGQAATNVIGQPNFTTNTTGTTSQKFSSPRAATLDAAGNRLFVVDATNHRVMVFDVTTVTDNPVAVSVLGQSIFTTATAQITQSGFLTPTNLLYDATNNLLFTSDSGNNRLIVHDVASIVNGEPAVNELGQYDANNPDPFSYVPIYTKGQLNDTPSRAGIVFPEGMAFDYVHHRFFVTEYNNNRVLVYNLDAQNQLIDKIPDFVLGQPDFNGNAPATTATGMQQPDDVAYDPVGNRLFVVETINSRVTVFDVSTITNGQPAINVLGQPNFTTAATGTSATSFNGPFAINYDGLHNHLFVTDGANNRVMIFDVAAITNNEPAINVLGQANFTDSGNAATATNLYTPGSSVFDQLHNRLFVTDSGNNRVMVYDLASITDGEPAVHVLGQLDFTANASDSTRSTFNDPFDVDYDGNADQLYVTDLLNQRVLVFDVSNITDGQNALAVIGQPNFTTSTSRVDRASFNFPFFARLNTATQLIFVNDIINNRVMIFDLNSTDVGGGPVCPAPVVFVENPNNFVVYKASSTAIATFNYNGCGVSSFALSLIDNGGTAMPLVTSDMALDSSLGSANWLVPIISTTHARLQVELFAADGHLIGSDISDADFTIEVDRSQLPAHVPTAKELFIDETIPASINENLNFPADNLPTNSRLCISGSLIKDSSSPTVYYCGADSRRYVFLNASVFYSWYTNFTSVITMSDSAISRIPIGGNVAYRPKQRLIKTPNDTKVYAVSRNGVLHWLTTEALAQELYGPKWNTLVDDIPELFMLSYSIGANIE